MKRLSILIILLLALNVFAAENIFMCFSGLNTFLKEQYKIESPENQYNINKLVSFGYERIGLKINLNTNDITVYDNYSKEYSYSFIKKEIKDEFVEYLSKNWFPEDQTEISSLNIISCNIEKVDSNSCGIFGNDFYITLDMTYIANHQTYTINETRKEFVKYQE